MATNKTVTVTVLPTLTGDTVASYNVYEGVSGTTLLGTMSVAEAAAGKVFAFTDGIVHSVKVQTVWTTAGASTIRSAGVELDLSVVTVYALQTENTDLQYVESNLTGVSGGNFTFNFDVHNASTWVTGKRIITNDNAFNINRYWGFYTGVGTIAFEIYDSVGTKITSQYAVSDGDNLKIIKTGDDFVFYINDVAQETLTSVDWNVGSTPWKLLFGARQTDEFHADIKFSALQFQTETWDFSEQTGTTASSDGSIVLTLYPGTGSTTTMWTTV